MQRIDGRYACTIQIRMDHEIILGVTKQSENESESVILVFVLPHFHSDSHSFFDFFQSITLSKSL